MWIRSGGKRIFMPGSCIKKCPKFRILSVWRVLWQKPIKHHISRTLSLLCMMRSGIPDWEDALSRKFVRKVYMRIKAAEAFPKISKTAKKHIEKNKNQLTRAI